MKSELRHVRPFRLGVLVLPWALLAAGSARGENTLWDTPQAPAAEQPTTAPTPSPTPEETPRRHRHRGGERSDVRVGAAIHIGRGETHKQDIVVVGGSATIEGTQLGDVVVIGGRAEVSGEIQGDLVVIGGHGHLASSAKVSGSAVAVGGRIHAEEGADVHEDVVNVAGWPGNLTFPLGLFGAGGLFGFGLTLSVLGWLQKALLGVLIALVIAVVLPHRVEAAGEFLTKDWLKCLGVGLLAFLLSIAAGVLLCITCVGWIVPFVFYQVSKYFGYAVLFVVVGRALARGASREVGPVPALFLGALVLSLIGLLAPVWFLYSWTGVGCALLTKFGSMEPWRRPANVMTPSAG